MTLRSLLYIIPILTAIWVFDRWVTDDGYIGWERNTVRNSMTRWLDPMEKWDYRRNAHKKVAIIGSSTSRDWLDPGYLQRLLGLKRGSVLDAHINGCRPGCTWAEVRLMLQRYRIKRCRLRGHADSEPEAACMAPTEPRFDKVFFGTNLFPMCEDGHSKRTLQHRMLTPTTDIPALFEHYLSAEVPLEQVGRFAGVLMSEAYADTRALKDYWGRKWLGLPNKKAADAWIRPPAEETEAPEIRSCDYSEDNIALQLRFTEGIMDDLAHLSTMSYVMLLPEKSIALDGPEHARRWAQHVSMHQALAAERPWIQIIDLTRGGANKLTDFRDDLHVKRRAFGKQRKVFENELERLGVAIDRASAQKRKRPKKRKKTKRKKQKTKTKRQGPSNRRSAKRPKPKRTQAKDTVVTPKAKPVKAEAKAMGVPRPGRRKEKTSVPSTQKPDRKNTEVPPAVEGTP